jgi:predicted ArsR family transcriptional regulator
MFSTYRTTQQGPKTRSHLLQHIQPHEELTRDDLAKRSGLTYDQVRRQTKNLCIEGKLQSRLERGQRFYRLR